MGYPCTSGPCPPTWTANPKPDPKGVPVANVVPDGPTGGFYFNALCVDTKIAPDKQPKAPATAGECHLEAQGTFYGYCNFAHFVGVLRYHASNGSSYVLPFKLTTVGTTTLMSGGSANTNIHGYVHIQHGSGCNTNTSSSLTLIGGFVLKDVAVM